MTKPQFSLYLVMETDVIFDCTVHIHLPEIYQQFYVIAQVTGQPEGKQILNLILKK